MKGRSGENGIIFIVALFSLIFSTFHSYSDAAKAVPAPPGPREVSPAASSPVVLGGKELFRVGDMKYIKAEERAAGIAERIRKLAEDLSVRPDSIMVVDTDVSADIVSGDRVVMIVLDKDAAPEGRTRQELAQKYAEKIRVAIEDYRVAYGRKSILRGAFYALIATIAFVVLLLILNRVFRRTHTLIETRYRERIHGLHIKSVEIVQASRVKALVDGTIELFHLLGIIILAYVYVHLLLSLFPWTRPFADQLLGYLLVPLRVIGGGIVKYMPNLLFIAVLAIIIRYGLKVMHLFFSQIEKGTISVAGFYPEWARPTDKLLSLLVIAFSAVVAFPYIPGSDSPAFKGVSIFIGVLFSLGSQSAVSNIIGGLVMTYRRAFKLGDRIRIGEITGDVIEIRLQLTHIRTIKNEDIIVPNSTILTSHVTNYSSFAREKGLILHTSVTIGYDAPWRQVHALLLMAAGRTRNLLKEPAPFVLQKSLDDFYVNYELNAYTDTPQEMSQIYSELHQNIQDCFNEYGVQIMSPHYVADPGSAKVVPKEKWYEPPARQPGSDNNERIPGN